MKDFEKIEVSRTYVELWEFDKLHPNLQTLIKTAITARENAQAPYSKYHVGAAVLSAISFKIYSGCNVERASYTQTSHAEQVAIDSMVATEGRGVGIQALAIVHGPANKNITIPIDNEQLVKFRPESLSGPCGHCRQIIWENCHGEEQIPILQIASNGQIAVIRSAHLFPFPFGPNELGININY